MYRARLIVLRLTASKARCVSIAIDNVLCVLAHPHAHTPWRIDSDGLSGESCAPLYRDWAPGHTALESSVLTRQNCRHLANKEMVQTWRVLWKGLRKVEPIACPSVIFYHQPLAAVHMHGCIFPPSHGRVSKSHGTVWCAKATDSLRMLCSCVEL